MASFQCFLRLLMAMSAMHCATVVSMGTMAPAFIWSDSRPHDPETQGIVDYRIFSPQSLIDIVLQKFGWSQLLDTNHLEGYNVDLLLAFVGHQLQSEDLSWTDSNNLDLVNQLKHSFTASNYSEAYPYVVIQEEGLPVTKSLISMIKSSVKSDSNRIELITMGSCLNLLDTRWPSQDLKSLNRVEDVKVYLEKRKDIKGRSEVDILLVCMPLEADSPYEKESLKEGTSYVDGERVPGGEECGAPPLSPLMAGPLHCNQPSISYVAASPSPCSLPSSSSFMAAPTSSYMAASPSPCSLPSSSFFMAAPTPSYAPPLAAHPPNMAASTIPTHLATLPFSFGAAPLLPPPSSQLGAAPSSQALLPSLAAPSPTIPSHYPQFFTTPAVAGDGILQRPVLGGDMCGRPGTHFGNFNSPVTGEVMRRIISAVRDSGTSYSALYLPDASTPHHHQISKGRQLASDNASSTTCNEICQTKATLLEGLLVGIVLLLILLSGLCCMMGIDSPMRFETLQES